MSAGDFWLVGGAYFLIVTLTIVGIHSILQHRRTGYLPRPIRFLIAVPYVLIFGTPRNYTPKVVPPAFVDGRPSSTHGG